MRGGLGTESEAELGVEAEAAVSGKNGACACKWPPKSNTDNGDCTFCKLTFNYTKAGVSLPFFRVEQ